MPDPLLPASFLFRYSVPCRYQAEAWSEAGANLGEEFRLPSLRVARRRAGRIRSARGLERNGPDIYGPRCRQEATSLVPRKPRRRKRRPASVDRHSRHAQHPSRRPVLPLFRVPPQRRRQSPGRSRRRADADQSGSRASPPGAARNARRSQPQAGRTAMNSTPTSPPPRSPASIRRSIRGSASCRPWSIASWARKPSPPRRNFRIRKTRACGPRLELVGAKAIPKRCNDEEGTTNHANGTNQACAL